MYISQVVLRDWKAYAAASFEFPKPTSGKNIILIGAPNGYGKTSFFEAVVLGMFGRDGLSLIARSPFSGWDKERLATSYKNFLENALHRSAIDAGRTSCSVKLSIVDEDGEALEIQRVWHFNDIGIYRPKDEEIYIFEGPTRKAIGPGRLESGERTDWYRDFIAENLLPFTLAHFFMFDGEQVSILAEREMSAQVRTGIEGLLGIPVLKQLAQDLRKYAEVRRKESTNISDKTIEKLEQERNELTLKHSRIVDRLNEIMPGLTDLKGEREHLTRELASFGTGSQALFQEQFEQMGGYERAVDQGRNKLEDLIIKDISLALTGFGLREKLKSRLISEGIRERWESGKNQGDYNLESFLNSVDKGVTAIKPRLTTDQRQAVLKTTHSAWEQLWLPPPENCAQSYLHPYLNELERSKVINRLDKLCDLSALSIVKLLDEIVENEDKLERLREDVTRTEAVAPYVDEMRNRLELLNDKIQKLDKEVGALEPRLSALVSEISQKNIDLTKHTSQLDQAKPAVRRTMQAEKVSSMIDNIVSDAVPNQIEAISKAMTAAHHSMVHKKGMVAQIDIDENCNVRLVNSEGFDVRHYDLSAGEKQIFTQALISAVSSVSGREFPMVVDTPLGRLDVEHRKGVLRHLVNRGHQVILLSTNTEVVGEYLHEIAPHVQRKYLINFEGVGDFGQSVVSLDYFENTGYMS